MKNEAAIAAFIAIATGLFDHEVWHTGNKHRHNDSSVLGLHMKLGISLALMFCGLAVLREPANKSIMFSAGSITARCAKDSAVKCLDLSKLADKAGGRYRARPSGLPERPDICVNDFRQTTSTPVIVVVISDRSESQRPKGLVRRFLRYRIKGYASKLYLLLVLTGVFGIACQAYLGGQLVYLEGINVQTAEDQRAAEVLQNKLNHEHSYDAEKHDH